MLFTIVSAKGHGKRETECVEEAIPYQLVFRTFRALLAHRPKSAKYEVERRACCVRPTYDSPWQRPVFPDILEFRRSRLWSALDEKQALLFEVASHAAHDACGEATPDSLNSSFVLWRLRQSAKVEHHSDHSKLTFSTPRIKNLLSPRSYICPKTGSIVDPRWQ